MNSSAFLDFAVKKLWEDFEDESNFPSVRPLLAHYTSIQTFEQIVTNEEIWFSNPLFMNDFEELQFGMKEGLIELRRNQEIRSACRKDGGHNILVNHFEDMLSAFYHQHALSTYVFCFSEHGSDDNDGLLSMWRGYGNSGSGAAIVINTNKINHNAESPLIFGKVRYMSTAERLEWIGRKLSDLSKVIIDHAKEDIDYHHAALAWFNRLKSFALFTKHHGFHEEKEWRVVYMSDRDANGIFKEFFSHLVTNRGVEPKLKLPVKPIPEFGADDLSLTKIVDRIILGPSVSSALATNALKQMLKNIGKPQLAERVVSSDIPFRAM